MFSNINIELQYLKQGGGRIYRLTTPIKNHMGDMVNVTVCYISTWAYCSCAAWEISGFSHLIPQLKITSQETLFKFFEGVFLEIIKAYPEESYNPEELLFLIGSNQMGGFPNVFVENDNLKKISSWKNKSHPPYSPVYLFRYSSKGDFNDS